MRFLFFMWAPINLGNGTGEMGEGLPTEGVAVRPGRYADMEDTPSTHMSIGLHTGVVTFIRCGRTVRR